ncbi:hypothetical protein O6P43_012219 [Quillaja saponaria]|uniref:Uncharacterized protein n=1 Tax=Quillaja saponaria TaxID=32244 RepID=A0AAD7M155_QUISA|nr:hypothetical protein O6P43_012219 [Quillaja saponaria]
MDPQMPNQMGRQRSNSNYTSLEMSLSFNSTQINVHVRNVDNNVDGGRNANQIWRQQHQPQPPPPPPPPSPNRNAAAPTAAHQHPPPYGLVWMNPFSNPAASAAHQYGYSLPPTATFCCCCRCHCGNQNPQPQGTTRRRCATCGTSSLTSVAHKSWGSHDPL